MKKIAAIWVLFLLLPFVGLQGQSTYDFLADEKYEDKIAKKLPFYYESLVDTLRFEGEGYFFRRTPLIIKDGYTSIIPEMYNIRAFLGPPMHKGYRLTWQIRNDSLYIFKIDPAFSGYYKDLDDAKAKKETPFVPQDTVIARLEAFIGQPFRNGLLFVDWISGDFPVVKADPAVVKKDTDSFWILYDSDYQLPPLIFSFKNGILTGIKEDKKGAKEWKKMEKIMRHKEK
jgi:hypothetical protein